MSAPVVPELRARVTLYPTAEGGRNTPILGGEYRTILGIGEEHFSARCDVGADRPLLAGETVELSFQFLFPEAALPLFQIGSVFSIWEGRDIGRGEVTWKVAVA